MEGRDGPLPQVPRVRVAKVITKKFIEPHGDEDTGFEATAKDYEANAKAQYALTQALNDDDLLV